MLGMNEKLIVWYVYSNPARDISLGKWDSRCVAMWVQTCTCIQITFLTPGLLTCLEMSFDSREGYASPPTTTWGWVGVKCCTLWLRDPFVPMQKETRANGLWAQGVAVHVLPTWALHPLVSLLSADWRRVGLTRMDQRENFFSVSQLWK